MRKTKPPVGWEHVKNCFPVPNILLDMDLPASAVAVYLYLLRSADRKTDQCHPSEATIAKRLHLSRNTVAKYVRLLEERGLIITEHLPSCPTKGSAANPAPAASARSMKTCGKDGILPNFPTTTASREISTPTARKNANRNWQN